MVFDMDGITHINIIINIGFELVVDCWQVVCVKPVLSLCSKVIDQSLLVCSLR